MLLVMRNMSALFGKCLWGSQRWHLGVCIVQVLRGHFWEFCIYIFVIKPLLFRMVGWGALSCVVYLKLNGIIPIAILVLF